jgi:aldehyde dehydrogenase (NAD+)
VQDVDKAVKAARKAFDEGPWRRMAAVERGNLMYKLADLMEKNADELAALESLDNGKPYSLSRGVDIPLAIKTIRYYAGWADKIHGRVLPHSGPFLMYTRDEAVGVCA